MWTAILPAFMQSPQDVHGQGPNIGQPWVDCARAATGWCLDSSASGRVWLQIHQVRIRPLLSCHACSYVVCPSCHAVEPLTGKVMETMKACEPVICNACKEEEMRFKVGPT